MIERPEAIRKINIALVNPLSNWMTTKGKSKLISQHLIYGRFGYMEELAADKELIRFRL